MHVNLEIQKKKEKKNRSTTRTCGSAKQSTYKNITYITGVTGNLTTVHHYSHIIIMPGQWSVSINTRSVITSGIWVNSSNNLCSYARSRAKTRIVSRFEKDLLVAVVATYSMNFHPLVLVTVVYIIALASASELSPGGPTIEWLNSEPV